MRFLQPFLCTSMLAAAAVAQSPLSMPFTANNGLDVNTGNSTVGAAFSSQVVAFSTFDTLGLATSNGASWTVGN